MKNFESEKNIFSKNQIRKKYVFWKLQVSKSSKTKFCGKTLNILASHIFWKCMSASRTNKVLTLNKLTFKGHISQSPNQISWYWFGSVRWNFRGEFRRCYCELFDKTPFLSFLEPELSEKPKIIEIRSVIRNIELIEVWRSFKNVQFKQGILKTQAGKIKNGQNSMIKSLFTSRFFSWLRIGLL